MMLSMTSRILTLLLLLTAALSSEQKMFEPRFSGDNQLARPEGYREWMFVGSNLNMGYVEGPAPTESRFHNIYIQREAYREYAATGKFPGQDRPGDGSDRRRHECVHQQEGTVRGQAP